MGARSMDCILNHCHEGADGDWILIVYYTLAVASMIIFALLSQSNTIQRAALMIAGVWLFSILYYLAVGGAKYFALVVLLDGALAFQFWRMSRTEFFPAPLCCLMISDILFILIASVFSMAEFWKIFVLNRIFELTLIYMIGSSIYRIRKLRPPEQEDALMDDGSFRFLAG